MWNEVSLPIPTQQSDFILSHNRVSVDLCACLCLCFYLLLE